MPSFPAAIDCGGRGKKERGRLLAWVNSM